jgi:hypothetical protein
MEIVKALQVKESALFSCDLFKVDRLAVLSLSCILPQLGQLKLECVVGMRSGQP